MFNVSSLDQNVIIKWETLRGQLQGIFVLVNFIFYSFIKTWYSLPSSIKLSTGYQNKVISIHKLIRNIHSRFDLDLNGSQQPSTLFCVFTASCEQMRTH